MQTNVHAAVQMELVHRSRTKTARLRLYCIYCKEGRKKGNTDEIIMYLGIFIITSHTHTHTRTHARTHTELDETWK